MKKHLLSFTMIAAGCLSFMELRAQDGVAKLMAGGQKDLEKLMNDYASPMLKSFGTGLNGGWFNTAKPHGIGGFDVTVSINLAFAPSSDQSFKVEGYKTIRPAAGQPNISPTVFGVATDGPLCDVVVDNPTYVYFEKEKAAGNIPPGTPNPFNKDTAIMQFNLPKGAGVNFFPAPTAQFNIGVGFGTEVAIRLLPTISAGDFSIGLFGFAVKHDFKQYIPAIKEMPFDLSAMFGYTSMKAEVGLSMPPDQSADVDQSEASGNYSGQKLTFNSSAWTFNALLSKKLGPLTPYMALGWQHANTTIALEGIYPIAVPNENYSATNTKTRKIEDIKDPASINGIIGGPRATFGVRLKLLLLTIHGDYTFATYNVASIGIGLNLQSIVPFKL